MNYRSIAISSMYFAAVLFASTYVIEPAFNYSRMLGATLALFIWCSPGYLAAAIARRHAVLHASIAGALCCVLAVAAIYVFEIDGFTQELGYAWCVAAIVYFGFGALVWSFKSWMTKDKA